MREGIILLTFLKLFLATHYTIFLSTDCYQIVTYYINITINLFVTENVCMHM